MRVTPLSSHSTLAVRVSSPQSEFGEVELSLRRCVNIRAISQSHLVRSVGVVIGVDSPVEKSPRVVRWRWCESFGEIGARSRSGESATCG